MIGEIDDAILGYFQGLCKEVLNIEPDHVLLSLVDDDRSIRMFFERGGVEHLKYPYAVVIRDNLLNDFGVRHKTIRCIKTGSGTNNNTGIIYVAPVEIEYNFRIYTDDPDQLNAMYTAWYFTKAKEDSLSYKPSVLAEDLEEAVPITLTFAEPEKTDIRIEEEAQEVGFHMSKNFPFTMASIMASERRSIPKLKNIEVCGQDFQDTELFNISVDLVDEVEN